MVFPCVLDFVVADPPQGLDEQHHGWYPGPSDLGSVMQRTRWHLVRQARHFLDGLITELNQCGMKRNGFDVPDARPFYRAILLQGKTLAGFASFLQQT